MRSCRIIEVGKQYTECTKLRWNKYYSKLIICKNLNLLTFLDKVLASWSLHSAITYIGKFLMIDRKHKKWGSSRKPNLGTVSFLYISMFVSKCPSKNLIITQKQFRRKRLKLEKNPDVHNVYLIYNPIFGNSLLSANW